MLAQVYRPRALDAPLSLVHRQAEVVVLLQHLTRRHGYALEASQILRNLAKVPVHLISRVFRVRRHRNMSHDALLLPLVRELRLLRTVLMSSCFDAPCPSGRKSKVPSSRMLAEPRNRLTLLVFNSLVAILLLFNVNPIVTLLHCYIVTLRGFLLSENFRKPLNI